MPWLSNAIPSGHAPLPRLLGPKTSRSTRSPCQLEKGGSDPVQVVKDFLPIVNHMHLKDYSGGESFLGYCPLGQGKVNIPAIFDMMEGRTTAGMIMVELDGGPRMPMTALETATIAKAYLEKQGVAFRSA